MDKNKTLFTINQKLKKKSKSKESKCLSVSESHQYIKTSKALTTEVATNAPNARTQHGWFTGPVGSSPKAF